LSTTDNQPWSLNRQAFDRLLKRLHADAETAAAQYELLRRKLIVYFELQRHTLPEMLADETLDRVARKLELGEVIQNVNAYSYGVARHILLEVARRQVRERVVLETLHAVQPENAPEVVEARVQCLERCLRELPEESRRLIVEYYQGAGVVHLEGRKELAKRLGLSYITLRTRAHRTRVQLEACMRACLDKKGNH
jgi:DNA-directed RNA polymerase specialized sigma24 family protein